MRSMCAIVYTCGRPYLHITDQDHDQDKRALSALILKITERKGDSEGLCNCVRACVTFLKFKFLIKTLEHHLSLLGWFLHSPPTTIHKILLPVTFCVDRRRLTALIALIQLLINMVQITFSILFFFSAAIVSQVVGLPIETHPNTKP